MLVKSDFFLVVIFPHRQDSVPRCKKRSNQVVIFFHKQHQVRADASTASNQTWLFFHTVKTPCQDAKNGATQWLFFHKQHQDFRADASTASNQAWLFFHTTPRLTCKMHACEAQRMKQQHQNIQQLSDSNQSQLTTQTLNCNYRFQTTGPSLPLSLSIVTLQGCVRIG